MSTSETKKARHLIDVKTALAEKYSGLRDRAKSDAKRKFFHHRATVYSRQAEQMRRQLPAD